MNIKTRVSIDRRRAIKQLLLPFLNPMLPPLVTSQGRSPQRIVVVIIGTCSTTESMAKRITPQNGFPSSIDTILVNPVLNVTLINKQLLDIDPSSSIFLLSTLGDQFEAQNIAWVAQTLRKAGRELISVPLYPFRFMGQPRLRKADHSLWILKEMCDEVELVLADSIIPQHPSTISLREAEDYTEVALAEHAKRIIAQHLE